MINLAQQVDKTIPGVVKAIAARRTDMLTHVMRGKEENAEKFKQTSHILNRIHRSS